MLDGDGTPLARRYYCPADEEEVDADHLVHGYELERGKVVVVTDEELEALAPKKSREIDLRLFVPRDGIDPLYFERSYFLAPGASSGKAYRLLVAVMEQSRRAGIATFVMRDKEYLIAIFADAGLLRGETLRFHDEVRTAADVGLPKRASVDASAVKRTQKLVASLAKKTWDPAELTDPHAALRELAERKYKKREDVVVAGAAPAAESGGEVVDLMEVLRRSLAENDLTAKTRTRAGATGRHATATKRHEPRKPAAAGAARRRSATRAKAGAKPRKSAARRP